MRLVLPLLLFLSFSLSAQLPNASFEDWTPIDMYDDLDEWVTSNLEVFFRVQPESATRIDGRNGAQDAAVRLETFLGDGKLTNGDYWNDGQGGTPYTEMPDSIKAWVRYDVASGMNATMRIEFSKNGTLVAFGQITMNGAEPNWVEVSAPISAFTEAPDQVNIVARSSNGGGTGSFLEIDEITLTGTTDQLPNHEMKDWSYLAPEDPNIWNTYNLATALFKEELAVIKTTDAYSGDYAVEIHTRNHLAFGRPSINGVMNTTGITENGSYLPVPFQPKELRFWYKYESTSLDSGIVAASFFKVNDMTGNVEPLGTFFRGAPEVDQYTQITIPITLTEQADSFGIFIVPDAGEAFRQIPQLGRKLTIDDIELVMTTSIEEEGFERMEIIQNPVSDQLRFAAPTDNELSWKLLNNLGQYIGTGHLAQGEYGLDVSYLNEGRYVLLLEGEQERYFIEFIKI